MYALDCLLTVVSDVVPRISTYEMQIRLPHPENLYTAASEDEWRKQMENMSDQPLLFNVLMELLLSGLLESPLMPRTLIGNFAVIHGSFSPSLVPCKLRRTPKS
jgi:hypothetical protein